MLRQASARRLTPMGQVPSQQRGEIVEIELLRHNKTLSSAANLLDDTGMRRVVKMPLERNEKWERAKPAFVPVLQEALDITLTSNAAGGAFGKCQRLELALGQERDPNNQNQNPLSTTEAQRQQRVDARSVVPGGWLEKASATMAEYGLEVVLDCRDGQYGFAGIGILDPESPEDPVDGAHPGTGCCG